MGNKYIYLLISIVYLKSTATYFLNDDLGSNLPDLYGEPIDENWQEKRSADKSNPSSSDDLSNIKKDLADYDYRNGNAEIEVARDIDKKEKMKKRENDFHRKFDKPLTEPEIEHILSQLSKTELNSLEKYMSDESLMVDVDKRDLLRENFDKNYNLNKRCGSKIQCEGYSCDEYDHGPSKGGHMTYKFYSQMPDKITTKRKLKYKRSNGRSPSREKLLQAKISLLKDNYKRNSEMAKMENSLKTKTINTSGNSEIRIPYRKKRSADILSTEDSSEDDPEGDEISKLQEVSIKSDEYRN